MATASLLPLPRFVAYDANGAPLAGGFVYQYVPGGTTPKTSWQDAAETIPNANPITLDAAGSALIYGSGTYQLTVTDSLGNQIPAYSGVTVDPIGGAQNNATFTGTTTFDGQAAFTQSATFDAATQFSGSVTGVEFQAGQNPYVDWLETYAYGGATTPVVGLSTIGGAGVSGASRTDLATAPDAATIGILGFGFANGVNTTIAVPIWGGYFEARKFAGSTGYAHGIEVDITNLAGGAVFSTPYETATPGTTNALWVASGGGISVSNPAYNPVTGNHDITTPNTSSCAIAIVNNGAQHNSGILFGNDAIVGTDGITGTGVAIGLAKGHNIVWYVADGEHTTAQISCTISNYNNAIAMAFNDGGVFFTNSENRTVLIVEPALTLGPKQTGLSILVYNTAGVTMQQVTLGDPDSGGTGFRALVVPN